MNKCVDEMGQNCRRNGFCFRRNVNKCVDEMGQNCRRNGFCFRRNVKLPETYPLLLLELVEVCTLRSTVYMNIAFVFNSNVVYV